MTSVLFFFHTVFYVVCAIYGDTDTLTLKLVTSMCRLRKFLEFRKLERNVLENIPVIHMKRKEIGATKYENSFGFIAW